MMTGVRIRACRVGELPPGEARRIEGDHPPLALYNVDGEYFALDDTCTHEKFCIRTGKALCLPANRDVASHPVEIIDGEVWIVTKADPHRGGNP